MRPASDPSAARGPTRRPRTGAPRAIRRRFRRAALQRAPLRSRGLSFPKVRHCHERAWSPLRADYLDRSKPLHVDPIALSISTPHRVAARLVVGPDDVRDVGVGNERYDAVAASGNGRFGSRWWSPQILPGPRFRLGASVPGAPQRASMYAFGASL